MKFLDRLYKSLTKFKTNIYKKIDNSFVITSNKYSKIIGVLFCFATLIAVILLKNEFLSLDLSSKWILLSVALLFPFIIAFSICYTIRLKSEKVDRKIHFIFLFLMPFLAITMTECLNSVFIYNMTYLGFFANYSLILMMLFLIFGLTGSFRVTYILVSSVLYGFALAHCYIMEFRGTPFIPMIFYRLQLRQVLQIPTVTPQIIR